MPAVSPITSQTVGKTFLVAISLLGTIALVQLCAIGWVFSARFHTVPLAESGGNSSGTAATDTLAPAKEFTDPFDASNPPSAGPASATSTATLVAGATPPPRPAPTPVSPDAFKAEAGAGSEPTPQDRFNELIEQGRALRDRGDTYAAITKFREAQVLDTPNALPLAELAVTYEKMGFGEKAAENWRKIYDAGESSGVYYTAAKAKLEASQAQELLKTMPVRNGVSETPGGPSENVGAGATAKLGLLEITRNEERDPAALRKFTLHVPLKSKSRAHVDVRDVTIQVLFYDAVDGRSVEKTNAQVTTRWSSPPPDWSDEDTETLEVTYLQPMPVQGDPIPENRKFFGYTASIYYKGALQDFRADPPRLAQQSPPPRTLPTDTAP